MDNIPDIKINANADPVNFLLENGVNLRQRYEMLSDRDIVSESFVAGFHCGELSGYKKCLASENVTDSKDGASLTLCAFLIAEQMSMLGYIVDVRVQEIVMELVKSLRKGYIKGDNERNIPQNQDLSKFDPQAVIKKLEDLFSKEK